MRRPYLFDVWNRLWHTACVRMETAYKLQRRADVQSCIDACARGKAEQEKRRRDAQMYRRVEEMTTAVNQIIEATDPKPNRITMEATAHPLPVLPSQQEKENAIAWLIYTTNRDHGPTVRYGTVGHGKRGR